MRREPGQLSLADGLVKGGAGRNRQLERIAALVDWAAFERLLGADYAAPVGRPSHGPVVLLKCLLLQQWYRLSRPGPRTSARGPAQALMEEIPILCYALSMLRGRASAGRQRAADGRQQTGRTQEIWLVQ